MSKESDFLVHAYTRMLMIRRFEEVALQLTQGDAPAINGSIHPCMGQEAIPVGTLAALRDDDRIVATYRGHGWALESGITTLELLAEMCHRQAGVNGGRAGSLMVNAAHRRFIGENSIVGAGGPIACGVALAAKLTDSGRIVAVSFGDGAMSQGALHEAMVLATREALPIIFLCENNGWAEMTPAIPGELQHRAQGYGMRGVTVDGCDPVAVRDSVTSAAAYARAGNGPTLLECRAVRLAGHYSRDIQHYRPAQDRRAAAEKEPVARLRSKLLESGTLKEGELQDIESRVEAELTEAVQRALEAPHPEPGSLCEHVYAGANNETGPDTGAEATENLTFAQAVNRALHEEMSARPEVIVLGEDVGKPGGIFGLTRGLHARFGARLLDTPIAESAILGSAVGASIEGLRPVAEIMFSDFLLVALDQLVNQAANVRYLSRGRASAPLVVRTQQGISPGSCAQHSQSLEALLAHIPGLRVGVPITPQDGYTMLRAAIADPDPCILFESRSAYLRSAEVRLGGSPEPARGAALLRPGTDVGIISWGMPVYAALEAADRLKQEGVDAAVLNVRWLCPLDDAAIERLVHTCGRVLIVHEANRTGGFGAEISARIAERFSSYLQAPVRRLGAPDIRMPAAPALQRFAVPNADSIVDEVRLLLQTVREPATAISSVAARAST